jgi:hypothetical protein
MPVQGLDLRTRKDELVRYYLYRASVITMSTAMSTRPWTNKHRVMDFLRCRRELNCCGAVHFFVNWRCIRNCRCNYRNEIDWSDELDNLKQSHQHHRRRDDAWAWQFSTSSCGEYRVALRARQVGEVQLDLFFSLQRSEWTARRFVRRRRYDLDESFLESRRPNLDATTNLIALLARLTLCTLRSTILRPKIKSIKIDCRRPEMSQCGLSGPPAPRFLDSIALEEWEQARIAGKGDKIQILLFLRVFHTKRTKTSAFLWVRYLILGSITSWATGVGFTSWWLVKVV